MPFYERRGSRTECALFCPCHHLAVAHGTSDLLDKKAWSAEMDAGPVRERALNIPTSLVWIVAVLLAFQIILAYGPETVASNLFINLSFLPGRFGAAEEIQRDFFWGPTWAGYATFFTYGLLHGDWLHLGVNVLWLVTFGSPVIRRVGASRFIALLLIGAAAGAAFHALAYWNSMASLIGASAGVSAVMGAAVRFVFDNRDGDILRAMRQNDGLQSRPLQSLGELWNNPTVLVFCGMLILTNVIFGSISVPGLGDEAGIAWQAHIGGFLAGFFVFPFIDPVHARLKGYR